MLSLSPRTVQNYVYAKRIPARKIGRRTLIPYRALEAFIRQDQPSPCNIDAVSPTLPRDRQADATEDNPR